MSQELPAFSGRSAACHRTWVTSGFLLLHKLDGEIDAFSSSDIVMMIGFFCPSSRQDSFRVHIRRHSRSHFESRNFFRLDESHS